MIPDEVIIRAGTNMLAHTDMVPLDYVRQALAEARELRGERMGRHADIERFVDRCLDDIRRGYTTRNIEQRRKARQALIDACAGIANPATFVQLAKQAGILSDCKTTVDESMVKRFLEAFQNTPGDEAIVADEKVARRWLTAALAAQHQEPTT